MKHNSHNHTNQTKESYLARIFFHQNCVHLRKRSKLCELSKLTIGLIQLDTPARLYKSWKFILHWTFYCFSNVKRMYNLLCTFCWDQLWYGSEIRVTSCGHSFHSNCLAQVIEKYVNNLFWISPSISYTLFELLTRKGGCLVCQSIINARNANQLFPLYLHVDVPQPLFNRVYHELALNVNQVQVLNIQFGRVVIMEHSEVNSKKFTIEVSRMMRC